jgi:hypothetical protein
MSLWAASVTKSCVEGVTPTIELMPVFSPTDCAIAGAANMKQTPKIIGRIMDILYSTLR